MSNLYIDAETDMIKTHRTARANKMIKVKLYFDDSNRDKYVLITMNRGGKGDVVLSIRTPKGFGEVDLRESDREDNL